MIARTLAEHYHWVGLTSVAMLLFLGVFAGVLWRVLKQGSRAQYQELADRLIQD